MDMVSLATSPPADRPALLASASAFRERSMSVNENLREELESCWVQLPQAGRASSSFDSRDSTAAPRRDRAMTLSHSQRRSADSDPVHPLDDRPKPKLKGSLKDRSTSKCSLRVGYPPRLTLTKSVGLFPDSTSSPSCDLYRAKSMDNRPASVPVPDTPPRRPDVKQDLSMRADGKRCKLTTVQEVHPNKPHVRQITPELAAEVIQDPNAFQVSPLYLSSCS